MDLQNALSELGQKLGVGVIELDDNGGCQLAFDDNLIIDIEVAQEEPGFFLTAVIGAAPQENRATILAELLEANLQGRGVGHCCLAMDCDIDEIILSRYFERDEIDIETLEAEIEFFLQMLTHWRDRYNENSLGTLRSGSSASEGIAMREENMLRP